MTQDEIIEMARQARLHRNQHNLASNPVQYRFSYDGTEEALIAFAKLVSAKEREACAEIADRLADQDLEHNFSALIAHNIRARGEA